MPRQSVTYDKELKETDEFQTLYGRYNSGIRKYREAFPTFQEFYDWSMTHGFTLDAKLDRWDVNKPYTPDNCRWVIPPQKTPHFFGDERADAIKKWNAAVNRIRIHFGLEPFDNKENESNENLL